MSLLAIAFLNIIYYFASVKLHFGASDSCNMYIMYCIVSWDLRVLDSCKLVVAALKYNVGGRNLACHKHEFNMHPMTPRSHRVKGSIERCEKL